MSFPDANSPSPHPPGPLASPGGDAAGFCGQFPMNPNHFNSHSQPVNVPPFKRLRNSGNNPPKFEPLSSKKPMLNPPNLQGGKGTCHIFYKTLICAEFLGGTCQKGELCTFAHGAEDLREPPPNWRDYVHEKYRGPGNRNDEQRYIQRMKICKRYYNEGVCPYGEQCIFLHEQAMKFNTDLARQRETSAISIDTTRCRSGSDNKLLKNKHVNTNSEAFQVRSVFWKTKICGKWEMTGECPFGKICHYAHGLSELQVPGGHIEAEPVVQSDSSQIKPLSIAGVDSYPANAVARAPIEEEEEEEEDKAKNILKWKLTKKTTGIYADWLDGFTPPRGQA